MLELTGKLDTLVNGPEGLPGFDGDAWERVDWRRHEGQVRRLRGRIFKAVQEGDWPLARSLQKLMLRSRSNTLLSVRQVTQRNAGRKTAGIDGEVALTSGARAGCGGARAPKHPDLETPPAVKRVYIPKAGDKTKLRPLGIPLRADRPLPSGTGEKTRWSPSGRPGLSLSRMGSGRAVVARTRSAADLHACNGPMAKRLWALDADLAAALDPWSYCSFAHCAC